MTGPDAEPILYFSQRRPGFFASIVDKYRQASAEAPEREPRSASHERHRLVVIFSASCPSTRLPFYSAIATGAASLVVVRRRRRSVVLITWLGKWRYLWTEWLTSVDHKRIGIMYIVLALVMLARAVIEGVDDAHAAGAGVRFCRLSCRPIISPSFSRTHGTIMIFFMAMPFLIGLINYVMPLQIGARDVSFPVMNSISLWLTAGGAGLMMVSLVLGKFSTGGWSGYPPYTELAFSPGVGPDYWIWAVTLSSIGTTMTGINFAVTIYKRRAPGMDLFRMPLFCWTALCTSILMIFAMPPLTVATAMLALDRYLGMHFFTNALGGNMMNFANLFWLFGHPEVYILILPAFGVYSEVIANFSAKTLYGYTSLVYATMAIAVLSFTVWLHHFFTMGQSANINAAFGIATMLIGIPTGVKIYDWILTMFRGRVRFAVPMLYALAFMVLFVIGGLSGILLANPGGRLPGAQHAVPGGAFPQHAYPGHALRHARRLPLLVPQGLRLPARRDLGPHRLRSAGSSASCWPSCRSTRSACWACRGARWNISSPPICRTRSWRRSARCSCCAASASLVVQLWVSIRRRERDRRVRRRPLERAHARMGRPPPAAGIQFRRSCRPCTDAMPSTP